MSTSLTETPSDITRDAAPIAAFPPRSDTDETAPEGIPNIMSDFPLPPLHPITPDIPGGEAENGRPRPSDRPVAPPGLWTNLKRRLSLGGPRPLLGIHTADEFRAIMIRERSASDRHGHTFSVVAFNVAHPDAPPDAPERLADILIGRIRLTDEVGWFGAHRIGALLSYTSADGAQLLAEDVCRRLGVEPSSTCYEVYIYPSEHHPTRSSDTNGDTKGPPPRNVAATDTDLDQSTMPATLWGGVGGGANPGTRTAIQPEVSNHEIPTSAAPRTSAGNGNGNGDNLNPATLQRAAEGGATPRQQANGGRRELRSNESPKSIDGSSCCEVAEAPGNAAVLSRPVLDTESRTTNPASPTDRIDPLRAEKPFASPAQSPRPTQPLEPIFAQPLPLWKRTIDIIGSSICIIVLSPLMLAAALAVKLTTPGPIFFKQPRSGWRARPFTCYKFRSMVADADDRKHELMEHNDRTGPVFKMADDPRITRVGRFIRKWSIDELPQLFNVLKGDMSLVGPRPPTLDEVEKYKLWHDRRLEVTPGITCLWQVTARDDKCFERWVRLDLEYARRRSFWLDVKILLKTFPAVLSRRGAC